MKFLNKIVQNTNLIMAFLLGGATFGGAILILSEQTLKHSYYLTKSNLALIKTTEKCQKLMVIQDSIMRLDDQIFKESGVPVQASQIRERIALMEYYHQTSTQLDIMLVHYRLGMDKQLQDHYYSKYQSFFHGKAWDKGGYDMGLDDDDDMSILSGLPE
ncbi:hypothetical protein JMN32_08850 [Fulvivirga sp. 29W222]|uniref:Uncharacterized protein n=1 Tax=Fulvivirga marina TaxID=2494733 RepID=A0A937FUR6_9BACT|nr:hypothetical protein [Fulvivirga marina]MBL6446414.1 hypothetical protein [Fulvivirga marina]